MKESNKFTFTSEQIKLQLADSSKALAYLTANMVFDNPAILKSLLEVTWQDEAPWAQRASRIISICCCRFPELIKPYVSVVLAKMGKVKSEGTRRNLLKIFMEAPVPLNQKEKARLLNLCFDNLTGSYSVSIKVYSMDVLFKLSQEEPDILRELRAIIEDQIEESSAGFKSRGNKILNKIRKGN